VDDLGSQRSLLKDPDAVPGTRAGSALEGERAAVDRDGLVAGGALLEDTRGILADAAAAREAEPARAGRDALPALTKDFDVVARAARTALQDDRVGADRL